MSDDPKEKTDKPAAAAPAKPAPAATGGDAAKPASPAPAAAAKPAPPPKPKGPVPVDVSDRPFLKELAAAVPDAVLSAKEFLGQTTVELKPAGLVEACRYLKTRSFTFLVDLTAVDWKARSPRFDLVYWLHSFDRGNERLRLRVGVAEGEACPTVTGVFKTANWMEREVYDLFGVSFADHPDLRRILTWDGFQGHPLRKDFPVEGIDTGAAIYPDRFPEGGGPSADDPLRKVVS